MVVYDYSQSTDPSTPVSGTVAAPPALVSISAAPNSMTFDQANAYGDIAVTGFYDDNSSATVTRDCTFVSSAPSVASVNAAGRVVALKTGTAVITATCENFTSDVSVTVNIVTLTHITTLPASVSLDTVGATQQLSVTEHFSDGSSAAASSGVVYTTGDAAVATVSTSGLVTAVTNGTTTVGIYRAGANPVTVDVTVNLVGDPAPVVDILNPADGSEVERGDAINVSVNATDGLGGVTGIYLSVTGETTWSDTIQISPVSLNTTQSFSFTVSDQAVIGNTLTISAWAIDNSAQTSTVKSITLIVSDDTAPVVSISAPAQATEYNYGDTVTITVNATDDVDVSQIRYAAIGAVSKSGTKAITPANSAAQATFAFTIPYGLSSPDITLDAYASDSAGNEGAAVSVDIICTDADITPPETRATAISNPGSGTSATVSYEVTAGSGDLDYVALYFRKGGIGTFNRYTDADGGNATGEYTPPSGATGTIVFDTTRMGGDGTYEFYTMGVDAAGNREPAPDDGSGNVVPDQNAAFSAGTVWAVIDTSIDIADGDTTYDNKNVRITGTGVVVTLSGSHTFLNMEILDGAMITHPETTLAETYEVALNLWTLTVDGASSINVDARGYLGGLREGNDSTGQTDGNTDGATAYAGGSFGGIGGTTSSGTTNTAYGNLATPLSPGFRRRKRLIQPHRR